MVGCFEKALSASGRGPRSVRVSFFLLFGSANPLCLTESLGPSIMVTVGLHCKFCTYRNMGCNFTKRVSRCGDVEAHPSSSLSHRMNAGCSNIVLLKYLLRRMFPNPFVTA